MLSVWPRAQLTGSSSFSSTAVSLRPCREEYTPRLEKNSPHDESAPFAAFKSLSSCTLMRTSFRNASAPFAKPSQSSSLHSVRPTLADVAPALPSAFANSA